MCSKSIYASHMLSVPRPRGVRPAYFKDHRCNLGEYYATERLDCRLLAGTHGTPATRVPRPAGVRACHRRTEGLSSAGHNVGSREPEVVSRRGERRKAVRVAGRRLLRAL